MAHLTKRFTVVGIILVVLFGGLGWYQLIYKPAQTKAQAASRVPAPVTISAARAKAEKWQPALTSVGTIRAVNGVQIAPEVDGVVRKINFESGQEVKAGALLVELDASVERAELDRSKANLKNVKRALDRERRLFKKGDVARASLDTAEANHDMAAAEVARIKALIDQKRIRAPFDGRTGIRAADLGEYLSSGTPIVGLQALDPIYADFALPEQNIGKLKVGQTVNVTVDALPDQVFSGSITSMDAQVDKNTRNISVRATFKNSDNLLIPGMFANVRVLLPLRQDVVTVPATAITYSLSGESVYLVTASSKKASKDSTPTLVVDRHTVRVGDRRGNAVAIIEGIKAGQRVVTSGQIKLQNGAHVRIDNSVSLAAPKVRPKN